MNGRRADQNDSFYELRKSDSTIDDNILSSHVVGVFASQKGNEIGHVVWNTSAAKSGDLSEILHHILFGYVLILGYRFALSAHQRRIHNSYNTVCSIVLRSKQTSAYLDNTHLQ